MNSLADSQPHSADAPLASVTDFSGFRCHPAFCLLALPVRATGVWSRDMGDAAVTIEPRDAAAEGALPIPTGKYLRVLLMHLCSLALRSGGPAIEIGGSAAELGAAMGLDVSGPKSRELGEQLDRLLGAKVTVALNGKPPLAVFDARGRPRVPGSEWKSSVKLNARFYDSLAAQAVALDPATVFGLMESCLAIDTYAWLTCLRPSVQATGAVPVAWAACLADCWAATRRSLPVASPPPLSLREVWVACWVA